MARPGREHFKQRNSEHAGFFPRLIDTVVTGLVSQERGAALGAEEAVEGCRTINLGRYEYFIASAVEDIDGIP